MKSTSFHITIGSILLIALLSACGQPTEKTQPIVKDVTETVFAAGALEAEGMYKLTAQTTGYLTQLNFKEGETVEKDHILAVIENTENVINTQGADELLDIAKRNSDENAPALKQAAYNIKISREKMEQDQKTEQRYKRLLESNSIARVDYENALLTYNTSKNNYESAVESYNKLKQDADQQVINSRTNKDVYASLSGKNKVKAVVRGKVYKKYKEVGDYVRQGDVIAEIGNPDILYAEVSVDESNIARIQPGQEAVIQLNTHPDQTYQGVVKDIDPAFDAATQSFLCRIYFVDPLDFNIVYTQLQTNIIVGEQKNALLIPRNYLDFGGYVQVDGQKNKTKVETQFVSNEWVQVIDGIDAQTTLVTDNITTN